MRTSNPDDGIHELLTWYANGTLAEEERVRFREHLSNCRDCREEMDALDKIREQLDRHGGAFLEDHPSSEELVAVVLGQTPTDAASSARVREHLKLCAACAREADWVAEESAAEDAGTRPERSVRQGTPFVRWASLAAVAAALAAAFLFGPWRDLTAPEVRIVRPVYVRPPARAAAEQNVFTLARGASHVDLVFEVDLAPASFPARIEILAEGGARRFLAGSIERAALLDGTFLLVDCPTRVCAPGSYVVRIESEANAEPALVFQVRVVEP